MEDLQHTIIFNNRELNIVIRALERMETSFECHEPEQSEAHAFQTQETLALIGTSLFKLRAAEGKL